MRDIWRRDATTAKVAWLRMLMLARDLHRHTSAPVQRAGLTMAQFVVLTRVFEVPGNSQGELASWLGVSEGNASQLVARLEAAGLVERRVDGRSYRLFITDSGGELLRTVMPEHDAAVVERFSVLTKTEQRQLNGLLRKLHRA